MKQQIESIVNSLVSRELPLGTPLNAPWERGSVQQSDRMRGVARLAAANYPGDFCEIGCLCGGTTSILARIAREFDRRVIAVDPWLDGFPNYHPDNYGKFLANTREWANIIDVVRTPSEKPQTIEYIKNRELCLAYVDGAHDYNHCHRDLETVSHAKVICADDMWFEDVIRAVNETGREIVYNPLCKEAFLI